MTGAGRAGGAHRTQRAQQRAQDQVRDEVRSLGSRVDSDSSDIRSSVSSLAKRVDALLARVAKLEAEQVSIIDGGDDEE